MGRAGRSLLRSSGRWAAADDLGRGQKLRAAAGQRAALAGALPEILLTRRRNPPRLVARDQLGRNVRFTPKADIAKCDRHVRFVPIADIAAPGCQDYSGKPACLRAARIGPDTLGMLAAT